MIVEKTWLCRWPRPPLTNPERAELWRRKYRLVPVEATTQPIKPHTQAPAQAGKGR